MARTIRLVLLASCLVWPGVVLASATPAGAGGPTPLTITGVVTLDHGSLRPLPDDRMFQGDTQGRFEARGAVRDAGARGGSIRFTGATARDSDVVHGTARFTGARGSLVVQFQALRLPFGDPAFDGVWTVAAATGTYARLRGTGRVSFLVRGGRTLTPVIDETWSGLIR